MSDLHDLATLLGRFTGTDQIHASMWADAEEVDVVAMGTRELDGSLLVQRVEEDQASGRFQVLNLFMLDPASAEVLLYSFDSLGYPSDPPARGGWTDGELVLHRTTERGLSRTVFEPTATGFRWSKQFRRSADDDWLPVVSGRLRRQEAEDVSSAAR